jgi:hypothetical protein
VLIEAGQSENYVHSVIRDFSLCELANDIYVFAYVNGKDVHVHLFPNKKGKERFRIEKGIAHRVKQGEPFGKLRVNSLRGRARRGFSIADLGLAKPAKRAQPTKLITCSGQSSASRHLPPLSFIVRGRSQVSVLLDRSV